MNTHYDPPLLDPGAWGLDRMMDIHDLAAYLGVPALMVYDWRTHGRGPTAYRFGKHPMFAVDDVRASWVAEQREPSGRDQLGR